MKIKNLKPTRLQREGGFAGISLAAVAAVAGIASAGVGIAAATGAFKPSTPGTGAATKGETISDAIQDANNQINSLTTQVNNDTATIKALQAENSHQTTMEYVALGLAGVSAGIGLYLALHHKKKS